MQIAVINAIASAGGSAGLIALFCLSYYLIKKLKGKKENTNQNTNTINVNSASKDQVVEILNELVRDNKNTLDKIDWKVQKLSIAMSYYVDNNGVKPEVKENFKKIIDAKRETD